MKITDEAKWFAIGQMLSGWTPGLTADEVLEKIGTHEVTVWQPFEDHESDDVYDHTIQLAENAQRLIDASTASFIASLKDVLDRFKSCVEGGSMIEGDKEAIATAVALLRKHLPEAPTPVPPTERLFRVRLFHDVEESAVISVSATNEDEAVEKAMAADHSDVVWELSGDSVNHGGIILTDDD